jgi:hypothetical protein
MEAEYVTYSVAIQDVIWLKSFLYYLKIIKSTSDSVIIYYDNTATIVMAKDPKYQGKTQHIKMRYHYIKKAITKQNVILKHIYIYFIVANPLTKPITRGEFVIHVRSLGICRM